MKTLVYLFVIAMLLFAGCTKDEIFSDNAVNSDLKMAKVPIPLHANLQAVPDMESAFVQNESDPSSYVPGVWNISGNCTHLGLVKASESYYEISLFTLKMIGDVPYLYQEGTGHIVGANGDSFNYTWKATASLDLNYTGEIVLIGGTGKMKGCEGTLQMAGKFDETLTINTYSIEGMMSF